MSEIKQKIIMHMLKKKLLDLKDLDLGQNPDILGWLGYKAGQYIAAPFLSGHLSQDTVMRHLVKIIGVYQDKSNLPMFKDTLTRNIELGMQTPATQEMFDDLKKEYVAEDELQKPVPIPVKNTFTFEAEKVVADDLELLERETMIIEPKELLRYNQNG